MTHVHPVCEKRRCVWENTHYRSSRLGHTLRVINDHRPRTSRPFPGSSRKHRQVVLRQELPNAYIVSSRKNVRDDITNTRDQLP
jgi:hypothetical protein